MSIGKILAAGCLCLIAASDLSAQNTPSVLTLRECVETALKNNPDVKKAGFESERDLINLRGAKGAMLPSLNASVYHYLRQGRNIDNATNQYINSSNTTASVNAEGDLTLFNGFRLFNNLKANQLNAEAGRMEIQQAKDLLVLNVILSYLDVLSSSDVLKQSEAQAAVTEKQVSRLAIQNEQGAIKPSEFYDVKGQLSGNKVAIINAKNALNNARLKLAQLMNTTYNESLTVEPVNLEQFEISSTAGADSIYQIALDQLAMIKSVDLSLKSFDKSVQSAKGGLWPTLSLVGGYNTNFSKVQKDADNKSIPYFDQLKNNRGTYAGIGLNIPLMNGFRTRNQLSMARVAKREAEFQSESIRIQLRQNIERDYLNMTATLSRYQVLTEQVASYSENFRAAEVQFENGAINSVDYLIAKNKLDFANIDLIIARYEYVLRKRIIDYYQGRLSW
ncbi:TolC family protein [Pseudoflavitalea sp. G-6-1-2]|uniref:TolC family protein n=1 Tax=Pseudoflavitalea sp. G-6-1-2 TaxID=2728841 RepID=UPI00146EEBE9|nr:TolC family protein [Pseudoflavitalea sp. G-6-1-2]NML23660.1 TolC family protein [Pseudoflavitalea sp. G-6-1-2]